MGGGSDERLAVLDSDLYAGSQSLSRNRNYLLLWIGQFISQMGDRLALVAFPWLIYTRTGSTLGTGVVLALYTLPYVLFGAFAGVVIDRVDKRNLMIAADVVRAALIALVPFAAELSLPSVYVLSFLVASVGVFFEPTKLAIIPEIVPRGQLMRANSLLATGDNITEILGYGLAGAILALIPVTAAFRLDAASFVVSAAALLLMRRNWIKPVVRAGGSKLMHELQEGASYVIRHRGLLANTVMVLAAAAGLGISYPLTFFLAVRVFEGGARAFGLFEASIGVGFLVGSVSVAVFARRLRKGLAMTIGLIGMGAGIGAVAAAPSVPVALIPMAAVGVANAVVLIAVDTYVQEVVPETIAGRVWGVRFALTQGTYALAVLAGGALASIIDTRALFVAAGLMVAVPGLIALLSRSVREA